MLSEMDHAVPIVGQWSSACLHTYTIFSVIRDITVYQMEFETNLYIRKPNIIFINSTYWKDSGDIPGSSDAAPAISLQISEASMEFFHANLRILAFATSSPYSSRTSENWRRSTDSVSRESLPEVSTICHKVSLHHLVMHIQQQYTIDAPHGILL
jgi:hypothetical protein